MARYHVLFYIKLIDFPNCNYLLYISLWEKKKNMKLLKPSIWSSLDPFLSEIWPFVPKHYFCYIQNYPQLIDFLFLILLKILLIQINFLVMRWVFFLLQVLSAKVVVTNAHSPGAQCYVFLTMSTAEEASKCIQHLNQTELHGKMIIVDRVKIFLLSLNCSKALSS